jgi:bisphosphoglycerate-dependent phosphoglycerate mutase family 1
VLVLLRHGESEWNAKDLFTGWIDVGLSELGATQALAAGEALASGGMLPDVVHTSMQRRAIRTADLERVSDEASSALSVPNATPLRYDLALPARP